MLRKRRPLRYSLSQRRWQSPPPGRKKEDALTPKERLQLIRLLLSGGVFVLLVTAKLLLPGKMAGLGEALSNTLRRSVDVTAVFSAVGELLDRGTPAKGVLGDLYQAVFRPDEEIAAAAPAAATAAGVDGEAPLALSRLRRLGQAAAEIPAPSHGEAQTPDAPQMSMDLVLYSDEALPDNVTMHQAILGFPYKTPVRGAVSSGFGLRNHPTEGNERFHYGLDLAAEEGTAIACFADGTVSAVGKSNSYGKYCIVTHANGCTTLYAHCRRIGVSAGSAVKLGQILGEVGQTGMTTGPHLHFELQKDGVYLDPIYYVETA